jgi:glycosyltransferase involved in cell wall biosynthesis
MKPTLTIGIAAYNEERNIGELLRSLLAQRIESARLIEIIVVSDMSGDSTEEIVESFDDMRIKLIRNSERLGLNRNQNLISDEALGDILILLDADIIPEGDNAIETLVSPFMAQADFSRTDFVGGAIVPAEPRTFVEKILARNHVFKDAFFESIYTHGDGLYLCTGPVRVFSRELYKKLRYPDNCPNDAYSYFFAKNHGYTFAYNSNARFIFRCPATMADHAKQSLRFQAGREAVERLFSREPVAKEYQLPRSALRRAILKEFFTHPILFAGFVYLTIAVKLKKFIKSVPNQYTSWWDIAESSKKI